MRPLWLGSSARHISRLTGGAVTTVTVAACPAFLAEHPQLPMLYAVEEAERGAVEAFTLGPSGAVEQSGKVSSGGSVPCHVTIHPDGGWLYTTNYGDGVVTAIALDDAGSLTEDRVELPHSGSGPRADRQERSHAHASRVSPGGGWLIVTDLGTDQLRSYRLEQGRPSGDPVLTTMPAGCGPRHMAVAGDLLYVAGELSCEVVTVRWEEDSGRGEVIGAVQVATLPVRTGSESTLSHLELVDPNTLVVGVRGADSVAVVGLVDGIASELLAEVLTVTWPRHLAVIDDALVVAGEQADLVAVHLVQRGAGHAVVGEVAETFATAAPMCILPLR